MDNETTTMLASGASFSGHERNHVFFGGLPGYQFERMAGGVSGLDDPGDSRAFATLDYDHDGWLDLALANVSAPRFRLMHNEMGSRETAGKNGFVVIRLVGGNVTPNASSEWSTRDGLGTSIEIELDDGSKIFREHRVDDGFKAQNSASILIGIGPRDSVRSVKLRWLSGRTQTVSRVASGTLLTIYENSHMSPTGESFVRSKYGGDVARARAAKSNDNWKSEFLPSEASETSLVLPTVSAGDKAKSTLKLYTSMATWCAICAAEMPELNALRSAFSKDQLSMFGVPIDENDTPAMLAAWADKLEPPYELLIGLPQSEVARAKAAIKAELHDESRTPATLVTDSDGNVVLATWEVPSISELRKLLWMEEDR